MELKENLTKEYVALIINGRQYRDEIPNELREHKDFKKFVICHFSSDDNFVVDGHNIDEAGMYDGGTAYFSKNGLISEFDDEDESIITQHYLTVHTDSRADGFIMSSEIPNASFNINEDDDRYCKGLVFDFSELKNSGSVTISRKEYAELNEFKAMYEGLT